MPSTFLPVNASASRELLILLSFLIGLIGYEFDLFFIQFIKFFPLYGELASLPAHTGINYSKLVH